ncbi:MULTISPECIES: SagB/ThcOx family dehydrogenase [unclassified Nonomuraea]|uniref:SagB/ThcOx family dehydrogenase n=1 Tax=unclassified Nonomuraea TaxID=2593643 RepID=UPI0033D21BC8
MRLRRRRCLVCYWHEAAFIAHPYPGGSAVSLPATAAQILTAFEHWTTPGQVAAALGHLNGATLSQAITALREHSLLLEEGSAEADTDDRLAHQWRSWEPEAPFFHYSTQDAITADSPEVYPDIEAHPPLFTDYPDAEHIPLPHPRDLPTNLPTNLPGDGLAAPLGQVLHARRTHRDFTGAPVPLTTLATLLAVCFAPVDYIDAGYFGTLYRRTSPAGGARQELDAYLAITNVADLDPGIYHYNGRDHSLDMLAKGFTTAEATHLCSGQDYFGQAAFLVILVAVIERMRIKYPTPRCYRVSLLNAGHLGQTFALTATALGLGPFQTGAFHDTAIAELLGLDNTSRTPLYVLGAGHPTPNPNPNPDDERAFNPAGPDALRTTPLT